MKKIKFAAQIFILAASFPVIFLSGITHDTKKPHQPEEQVKDSSIVKKTLPRQECLCQTGVTEFNGLFINTLIKY